MTLPPPPEDNVWAAPFIHDLLGHGYKKRGGQFDFLVCDVPICAEFRRWIPQP